MKKLLLIITLLPILALAQTQEQNYVKTTVYRDSIGDRKPANSITYLDGLGRPIQQIVHKQAGNGNDLVTHIEYDAFGRQVKEFLPIVNGQTLDYHSIDSTAVIGYYANPPVSIVDTTANPYSEKLFEASPLNRILKQAAPGDDWAMGNGHEVRFDYQTNTSDEVRLFKVGLTPEFIPHLIDNNRYYNAHTLYKTVTSDENWKDSETDFRSIQEFKDKEGRVVLKRIFAFSIVDDGNMKSSHDTYYIYDDYGNLTYVIPPIAYINRLNETELNSVCYQYKYDYRNRLIEKKLPGKQWEYIAYNNQDMPVATGPVKNPWDGGRSGWMITKYDIFGRVVYTGWYESVVNNESRRAFESALSSDWAESFTPQGTNIDDVAVSYTNTTFPTEFKLLTVNYYDTYDYVNPPILRPEVFGQAVMGNVKGLATGNWVRILNNPTLTDAERSHTLYDRKGRPIRTYKTNYLEGYTFTDSKLDFAGKPEYTYTFHKRTNADAEIVVKDTYEYTNQDRLLVHKQQITGEDEQLITKNDYDDLGQLISKQVGGEDITTYVGLQKVDYRYNIRGWLKSINDVSNLQAPSTPTDLFAFKINYNTLDTNPAAAPVDALYNGNIAETFWRTNSDNVLRKYGYEYDFLNRLNRAIYQKPNRVMPVTNMYNESISYDKNGNITHLQRYGDFDYDQDNIGLEIDNLKYTYDPDKKNQLMRVQDSTASTLGFKDDETSGEDINDDYTYDDYGNMTSDSNKNIEAISYNHLNLPVGIIFRGIGRIVYLYNANGQKVSKKVISENNSDIITDYLDGFQYTNARLNFFPHTEGYVNITFCEQCEAGSQYLYDYVYNYTDHLGNIRLSYAYDTATEELKILEENHYYPFGLKHTNYSSGKKVYLQDEGDDALTRIEQVPAGGSLMYKYKFQGQERQDELGLNWDSFKYRNYDYAIGRFMSIDPLAEKFQYNSPYAFQENKMGMGIELEGLELFSPWLGGLLGSSSPITSTPLLGTSDAVKLTTEVGGKSEMHHLIPRAAKGNDVVKAAREEGFKFEGSENKMPVDKFSKATGEGQHGNHPSYNKGVLDKLGEFTKTSEGQSAAEFVRGLVKDLKENIKSNPDKKINDLLKTVAPVKENTAVPLPKVDKIPQASNEIIIISTSDKID